MKWKWLKGSFYLFVFTMALIITQHAGYLSADEKQRAIVVKESTAVYAEKNAESEQLQKMKEGAIINYQVDKDSKDWLIVKVEGENDLVNGYIHKSDVELASSNSEQLKGIALNDNTKVYQQPTTNAKAWKDYEKGSYLYYRTLTSNWYEATVIIDGKHKKGFIYANDVEEPVQRPKNLRGIAIKNEVHVYKKANKQSNVLKSYDKGELLYYKTFIPGWYKAVVYINGTPQSGFIAQQDVDEPTDNPISLSGISLKENTNVYANPGQDAKVLKDYPKGKRLYYKTFIDGWYQATVYLKGKRHSGYIKASDVEQPIENQKDLKGISVKKSTIVYSRPSRNSSTLKAYNSGNVLYYQTYMDNWYEAVVYINGSPRTGYIHVNDVEEPVQNQKSVQAYAMTDRTHVYTNPSKDSKSLKSYNQGHLLYFKTFIDNWYEAVVYKNGKKRTGYIYTEDVEVPMNNQKQLKGYAYRSKVNIYTAPSKKQDILKSYNEGDLLYYQSFMNNWYEAVVYLDGDPHTGYIHKNDIIDVDTKQKSLKGMAVQNTTYVYSNSSKDAKKLKGYNYGSQLQFESFTSNWYEAVVYLNGNPHTGYIHKDDVAVGMKHTGPIVNPKTVYSYDQMVKDIRKLEASYQGLISTDVIGQSVLGRDIHLVKVGTGDKKITINAAHHAREWITTNLVMKQIDEYSQAYVQDDEIDGYNVRNILDEVTIYYIPMVNPDGVTLNQFGADNFNNRSKLIRMNNGSTDFISWKANARGVDLNRQYPANWKNIRNVASNPGPKNYKGTSPLSEPEVKALYDFTLDHNFDAHVAYHSSGELLYWAYNSTGEKRKEYRRVAEKVSEKTGYYLYHPDNPSGGGYTDWVIDSINKIGLTPEVSPYVEERSVPLSNFDRIWRQNDSLGLLLAEEVMN
ncbi:hypothetical protein GWK91_11345 [Virgibacillus sp. MSP4-1]|uniref:M14 family metallocarboxypeptidase n=1 Tax=Virgibacillus sp. MSP4-1 TaxID=2700081 RepID=UPI0003A71117|nr:M14 family metallocarboxypeptidase [Virgibacillus sp. MSP4-1]QHS23517.1 hypothetical protein GWK91_11345 [Virgibacillus sp. MSP4-1]